MPHSDKTIKSGGQIIEDFLNHLEKDPSLDKDTLAAIKELYKYNELTLSKLKKALETKREDKVTDDKT